MFDSHVLPPIHKSTTWDSLSQRAQSGDAGLAEKIREFAYFGGLLDKTKMFIRITGIIFILNGAIKLGLLIFQGKTRDISEYILFTCFIIGGIGLIRMKKGGWSTLYSAIFIIVLSNFYAFFFVGNLFPILKPFYSFIYILFLKWIELLFLIVFLHLPSVKSKLNVDSSHLKKIRRINLIWLTAILIIICGAFGYLCYKKLSKVVFNIPTRLEYNQKDKIIDNYTKYNRRLFRKNIIKIPKKFFFYSINLHKPDEEKSFSIIVRDSQDQGHFIMLNEKLTSTGMIADAYKNNLGNILIKDNYKIVKHVLNQRYAVLPLFLKAIGLLSTTNTSYYFYETENLNAIIVNYKNETHKGYEVDIWQKHPENTMSFKVFCKNDNDLMRLSKIKNILNGIEFNVNPGNLTYNTFLKAANYNIKKGDNETARWMYINAYMRNTKDMTSLLGLVKLMPEKQQPHYLNYILEMEPNNQEAKKILNSINSSK